MQVEISWPRGALTVELNDTPNACALADVLPWQARANTWGEEVYFEWPVTAEQAPDATDTVAPSTVCYWCSGKVLALPFGRTPISEDNNSKLIAPVNIVGRITGDARVLASVVDGDTIRVVRVDT
jgi:hypothetical protein